MQIFSDERTIDKVIKEELGAQEEAKVLTGNTACPGKARGQVKIIETIKSAKKMEKGNVLVASVTTPDMMAVIHQAAAIVTDEGGITCHAAIVSRELKIPCVIATEVATKVLKDGDLVEVDAEKGIVRRLEK